MKNFKKKYHLLKTLKGRAIKMRGFILDTIFPIECLHCKKEGVWFCEDCFKKLQFENSAYCLHCYKKNEFGEFCQKCKKLFSLDGIIIAGNYDNKILATLIKNFKYQFNQELKTTLAKYLIIFLKNFLNKNRVNKYDIINKLSLNKIQIAQNTPNIILNFSETVIIPVPLHKKRLNYRGFNQAELLSQIISNYFNLALNTKNLKRIKYNQAQAKLKGKKRYKNLKNNFIWQGSNLNNKNILLIDDVVTTGTTLNECAKVLKKAGAKEVWGLVLAKG